MIEAAVYELSNTGLITIDEGVVLEGEKTDE